MKAKSIPKLIIAIILCELIGNIGSIFTFPAIGTWYSTLQKPWFTPPNWVFGPVWTTLFLLMGIAVYLVWEKGFKEKKAKIAIAIFAVQFALNILWSALFFGMKNPFLGFVGIILLWISILATIIAFYKIDKKAGIILIPYIAWVSIATALNYGVMVLNP